MKAIKVKEALDATILAGEDLLDEIIETAFSSDMMSDVLAFSNGHSALLTGLCNPQVIRTVEMMDIPCIIFIRDKTPNETVINMAKEKGIILMSTSHTMFVTCGILYNAGIGGGA